MLGLGTQYSASKLPNLNQYIISFLTFTLNQTATINILDLEKNKKNVMLIFSIGYKLLINCRFKK